MGMNIFIPLVEAETPLYQGLHKRKVNFLDEKMTKEFLNNAHKIKAPLYTARVNRQSTSGRNSQSTTNLGNKFHVEYSSLVIFFCFLYSLRFPCYVCDIH